MALSDFEILAWSTGKSVIKKIAAFLAGQIRDGRLTRFDELPDTDELAREWDTTMRSVGRAKRLLYDRGLTKKTSNGRFYVA